MGSTSSIYDGLHNQLWGSWTTERSIPQNAKNFRVRVRGTRSASQVAAPTIEGSPALSEAGSDGTWTPGEAVQVTLTFSEAVNVVTTDGTPSIGIQLGGTTDRRASFASGSGTTELVFSYTLTEADGSHSSMFVPANGLTLNGGTITSNVSGAAAALEHTGAARAALPTAQSQGAEADRPTARFADLPQSHDGTTAFTVELHFSENIAGLSYTTVGGGLLVVTGATVTGARRLNPPSNQSWEVTVKPTQDSDITITLPARACTETNAVCVDSEPLAAAAAATVPAATVPVTPFTGTFGVSPAEHDGDTPFKVHFHLSVEPADMSYKTVRASLFTVTGGKVTGARRLTRSRNQNWEVTVDPTGASAVAMTVRATTACTVAPGICTEGGRMLPGGERLTVDGPGALSVADATAEEGTDDALEFVVTLSRPRFAVTTVQYATSDGQAVKGADYTETTGTLRFEVRETQKIIRVPVLDDDLDDTGETLTLTLSSPGPERVCADCGRRGDRDDHQQRPAAARADGPLRPHGGRARGRARGRTAPGAAGAGLPGPGRGPGAAAGDGARTGARRPQSARSLGRRESARRGRPRSDGRRTGRRRGVSQDAEAWRPRWHGHGDRTEGRPSRV